MVELNVDLCLFDLDGTLVNTIGAAEAAWIQLCKKENVDPVELFKFSHGVRTTDVLAKFFPNVDNTDNKGVKELESAIANDFKHSVRLVSGSKDLLLSLDIDTETNEKFQERKWAIITSGSPYCVFSWFDNILKEVKKPDIFITSFDVTKGKPHPEGYAKAKSDLCKVWELDALKTKAVVFEDAPAGLQAGKAMGALTIGITSSYDKALLFEAGADYVVNDLSQVKVLRNTLAGGITLKIIEPLTKGI